VLRQEVRRGNLGSIRRTFRRALKSQDRLPRAIRLDFSPRVPLYNLGTDHVHDFGLNQSKIIVI
jgi:hypothetical protein